MFPFLCGRTYVWKGKENFLAIMASLLKDLIWPFLLLKMKSYSDTDLSFWSVESAASTECDGCWWLRLPHTSMAHKGASLNSQRSLLKRLTYKTVVLLVVMGEWKKKSTEGRNKVKSRPVWTGKKAKKCLDQTLFCHFSNNSHGRILPSACSTLQGRHWLQTCVSACGSARTPSICSDLTEHPSA